ncbi:hypothetical protein LJC56_05830 [Christensenellaceae bacterium OttesenSCG-928-K19]|nr:hypothetical protein [Christensenellaceae bacterium OttesenSCG-928-K19]
MTKKRSRNKIIVAASYILILYAAFMLFVMIVAGRGIIFFIPAGWVLLAQCVLCMITGVFGLWRKQNKRRVQRLFVWACVTLVFSVGAAFATSPMPLVGAGAAAMDVAAVVLLRRRQTAHAQEGLK